LTPSLAIAPFGSVVTLPDGGTLSSFDKQKFQAELQLAQAILCSFASDFSSGRLFRLVSLEQEWLLLIGQVDYSS
jgi:hypothetical protein